MQAAQMTRMALARVLDELRGIPDIGARAAATTFTSPASTRLKAEVASIGTGIADAETRIAEMVAYLATVEAKYQRLFVEAEAAREKWEKTR